MPRYSLDLEGARQLWNEIPGLLKQGLLQAPRDFCALECLANSPLFSKPDAQKIFLLWEARNGADISIRCIPGAEQNHAWLLRLFVSPGSVRFPFNTWDTKKDALTLSPDSIRPDCQWTRCTLLIALKDEEIPAQGLNAVVISLTPQAMARFIVFDRQGARVLDVQEHALPGRTETIRELKQQINEICFQRHFWTEAVHEPLTQAEENLLIAKVASMFPAVEFLQSDLFSDWGSSLLQLSRWSTASRSCLVLIPESDSALSPIRKADVDYANRFDIDRVQSGPNPNVPEWQPEALQLNRFCDTVKSPGAASQARGMSLGRARFRLYSLKTGVSFVGSRNESDSKGQLEDSCDMAMRRSECINSMVNNDITFGIQTEVLTITAPMAAYKDDSQVHMRDGFQVRDLSCMQAGLDYLPCQAIPYALEHFDAAHPAAEQCAFWRKAFAIPLGRAKARIFLNYGLIHQSANAQNFLLGFRSGANQVAQFVVRDVGDTGWHDRYVDHYLKDVPQGKVAYDKFLMEAEDMALGQFDESLHHYCLESTTDKTYPAPLIVRLAANALLTHDFAATLKVEDGPNWSDAQIYEFATGILDGFWAYFREALGWDEPQASSELETKELDPIIKLFGISGKYPYPKIEDKYGVRIEKALEMSELTLVNLAAQVRSRGRTLRPDEAVQLKGRGSDDHICTLINAEELLLCARIEKKLGTHAGGVRNERVADRVSELLAGQWPPVVP